jgi:hypothetical protein
MATLFPMSTAGLEERGDTFLATELQTEGSKLARVVLFL